MGVWAEMLGVGGVGADVFSGGGGQARIVYRGGSRGYSGDSVD